MQNLNEMAMNKGKISAILPAAGSGKRFAAGKNKLFLSLEDRPILSYGVAVLSCRPEVGEIIIAAARGEEEICREIAASYSAGKPVRIVPGGKERLDSVAVALEQASCPLVMVHDGARPLLDNDLIDRLLAACTSDVAGVIPVLPVQDTIKQGNGFRVAGTLDRASLWAVQTPQIFWSEILRAAYAAAKNDGVFATDDAALVEAIGGEIAMVLGSDENIKITRPLDLDLATLILRRRQQ